jgi:hypothetical protein
MGRYFGVLIELVPPSTKPVLERAPARPRNDDRYDKNITPWQCEEPYSGHLLCSPMK